MTTAVDFEKSIDAWISKVKEQSNRAFQGCSVELVSILKRRSPILTGAFRGNWKLGVNQPKIEFDLTDVDKVSQGSIPSGTVLSAYKEAVAKAQIGDAIYANDSVPYALLLEGPPGFSKKAPNGIAKEGFAEFEAKIDTILAKLINEKA